MLKKNKIFPAILILVLTVHLFAVLHKFMPKQKEQKVVKRTSTMTVKNIVLQKPKNKPKPKRKRPPKYVPAFSSNPVLEELIEEEFEPEEEEEIWIEDYIADVTELDPYISEDELSRIKSDYINQIYTMVEKNKFYPKMAKRLNQEGAVEIAFTILRDGSIVDIALSRSSKFICIDNAALEAVKKIIKLSPIPAELEKNKWELILPIKFELS